MEKGKVLSLEDRIPKIKEYRKRKANRRLILLLSIFFLLIVMIVYFQSPLSHIKSININGNQILLDREILAMSGLKQGDNIWKMNKKKVETTLRNIPEIKEADVKIKFPNVISINIKEHETIALFVADHKYYPVLENGNVLKENTEKKFNAPILMNFERGSILDELINELNQIPPEIQNSISEIHYDPKKTDKYHIYMFMNDGFEVNATISTLSAKMLHYPSIISQLDPKIKGVIDIEVGSFFKAYDSIDEKMEVETAR